MRVHHLNCGTLCPLGARLWHGRGGLLGPGRLVCHCLLLEASGGLVLVDTGLGTADLATPTQRLGRGWRWLCRPNLDIDETAVRQTRALGFDPAAVTDIVLTHLDLDHAGGLSDFPQARVHVLGAEHAGAMARRTRLERSRYRPVQWAHGPQWVLHEPEGERWLGFEAVRALEGGGEEVLLIPLPGHTAGHCGVAVRMTDGWLLHAGDALYDQRELTGAGGPSPGGRPPWGVRLLRRMVTADQAARRANLQRLVELAADAQAAVRIICGHDAAGFDEARSRSQPGATLRRDGAAAGRDMRSGGQV